VKKYTFRAIITVVADDYHQATTTLEYTIENMVEQQDENAPHISEVTVVVKGDESHDDAMH
jgi:hypothetical protein